MKKVLLFCAVLLLCGGCACAKTAKKNNEMMLLFNIGQPKEDIMKAMGKPVKNEKYTIGGSEVDVWYYRTDCDLWDWDDDDLTPMVFRDNKLIGWGSDLYLREVEYKSGLK